MKRIIIDYKKLTSEILNLLIEKYPEGYDYDEIISFKNLKGETIKAVEVRDLDTIYLVKISSKLEQSMDDFNTDDKSLNDKTFADESLDENF
jgi:DNA-directed RNA polymerase subunit delta